MNDDYDNVRMDREAVERERRRLDAVVERILARQFQETLMRKREVA